MFIFRAPLCFILFLSKTKSSTVESGSVLPLGSQYGNAKAHPGSPVLANKSGTTS